MNLRRRFTTAVPEDRLNDRNIFLSSALTMGVLPFAKLESVPTFGGFLGTYLTLLKIGMLFVGRSLRWIWTCWNPKLRFYRKAMVWMTAGEIAEVWSQSHEERNKPAILCQTSRGNCILERDANGRSFRACIHADKVILEGHEHHGHPVYV